MFTTQHEVKQWFSQEKLNDILGPSQYTVKTIAKNFILSGGHRWRPWLCAGVYEALGGNPSDIMPLAIAIECFHKASLIHDDIEDNDKPSALHMKVGMPQALNAGDYLIHAGYLLIHHLNCRVDGIIQLASTTQIGLCCGQGEELATGKNDYPELKTVPLFELAFRSACMAINLNPGNILEFCSSLGQAFQAKDDLEDGCGDQRIFFRRLLEVNTCVEEFFTGELKTFLRHYVDTMFGQSAAAAAASIAAPSAAAPPTAASDAPDAIALAVADQSFAPAVSQPLAQSFPPVPDCVPIVF